MRLVKIGSQDRHAYSHHRITAHNKNQLSRPEDLPQQNPHLLFTILS
jgi:hypothetical protein